MTKRAWRAVGGLAAIIAIAVGSYLVGTRTQSDQEAAARAGSVQRTQLTEPVASRVLSTQTVFRVTYKAGSVSQISSAPTPQDGADPVVTSIDVSPGDSIKAGRAMIAVAGQPVFALRGSLPMYRDLQRGETGPDVTQLQKALADQGYLSGSATGTYDARTARAVAGLWRDAGFTPVTGAGDTAATPTDGNSPAAKQSAGSAAASASVPKGSIVYFKSLPVTIAKVETKRGGTLRVGDNWAAIRTGQSVLTTQIPVTGDTKISIGTAVALADDVTLTSGRGVVASVGTAATSADGDGQVIPATITVVGRNPFRAGTNLRGNITLKSTKRVVLSVPTVAVRSGADGSQYVVRIDRGKQINVTVATGLAANGYTQITSSTPALAAGQAVAVN